MNDSQLAKKTDSNETQYNRRFIKPRYEIEPSKESYLVRVYTPGATREGVNITLEKDTLTITAERRDHVEEGWKALSREIRVADYQLHLQLNVAINEHGIAAKLNNGVLDVILPIAEEAKPRKIAIK